MIEFFIYIVIYYIWYCLRFQIIGPIIVGIGLLGNVLNLIVLTRPSLKGVTYSYLIGLAFSDLGVLSCSILMMVSVVSFVIQGQSPFITTFFEFKDVCPLVLNVLLPFPYNLNILYTCCSFPVEVIKYSLIW